MAIKCPVCKTIYENKVTICTICRFTELNKMFLSQEDYQEWMKSTVKPFREMYQRECSEKEKMKEKLKQKEEPYQQAEQMMKKEMLLQRESSDIKEKGGRVVAIGNNDYGQCDVEDWTGIISIACGGLHTVGLMKDSTVVATGNNVYGQCDVENWWGIEAIACGLFHIVGLRKDGTVVVTGKNENGECDVEDWTGIISITCGGLHTVGLKKLYYWNKSLH